MKKSAIELSNSVGGGLHESADAFKTVQAGSQSGAGLGSTKGLMGN